MVAKGLHHAAIVATVETPTHTLSICTRNHNRVTPVFKHFFRAFMDSIAVNLLARPKRVAWFCLVLGSLGALALPPFAMPLFFLVPFALFAALLRGSAGIKQTFFCSFLFALGTHFFGLYWISASLFTDIGRYFWVLPLALLALPAYLALLFAAACTVAHPLRLAPVAHAVGLAVLVFFSEMLRGVLLTGFPWNWFGYIWLEQLPLLQSTALFGIQGLTLLTVLAATSLSLLAKNMVWHRWAMVLAVWGGVAGLWVYGVARLDANPTLYQRNGVVRLVQPAVMQDERHSFEQRAAAFARLLARSASPSTLGQPITHLLWAETATPYTLNGDAGARRAIARLVPPGGAVITGAPNVTEDAAGTHYFNALNIVDKQAAVVGIYHKTHLVPFGEYIPFHHWLHSLPIAADVIGNGIDFSAGEGAKTLHLANFPPFAPMICYEAIYSGKVVDKTDPPQLLVQITNDAWFGQTPGPYQHAGMARVRAIEEGLPLLRAANSGISMVVDGYGRVIKALPLGAQGVLDSRIPRPTARQTLFSHFGTGWVSAVAALLGVAAILTAWWRDRVCSRYKVAT